MENCKGCGKPIVWADIVDESGIITGKKVPLDPKPPVYVFDGNNAERHRSAMVSHFATCSKANDFIGSKKGNRVA